VGSARTAREHRRPVLAPVHGHAVLGKRVAVVAHLLAQVGGDGARDLAVVGGLAVGAHHGHATPVLIVTIVQARQAAGTRKLGLLVGQVRHLVGDLGHHAKGLNHAVGRHVAKAVEVVQIAILSESSSLLLSLLVLLNVGLGVGQVAGAGGVAAADGALLEVTLEDVTSRERIAAQDTHVRAVAGV
jgi:hypothetical protein